MQDISFEALGTKWVILIDTTKIPLTLKPSIINICQAFEEKYSRFKTTSLVSRYNAGQKIQKNTEFNQLVKFGQKLEKLSQGYFNCHSGSHLSKKGYGSGSQGLDFGAYGKGWLIDKVAKYLLENNYTNFLINAGGDIFATQKNTSQTNKSWTVALEHPTQKDLAIGTIKIKNQALAASSPFKRSWGKNNHLINGKTGQSIEPNRFVFTLSKNATIADGLATTLNVVPHNLIEQIASDYSTDYLVFTSQKIIKSKNFDCILF